MEDKLDIITIGESLVELSAEEKLKDAEYLYKYYAYFWCFFEAKKKGNVTQGDRGEWSGFDQLKTPRKKERLEKRKK